MMEKLFVTLLFLFSVHQGNFVEARTCYECYDKLHCQSPSTIICPSDDYGCATAIIDIAPFVTKGCLTDEKGPFKLNGCKKKSKNGVTGQLCGCMNEDLCNTECIGESDCSLATIEQMSLNVDDENDTQNNSTEQKGGKKKKGKGKNKGSEEDSSNALPDDDNTINETQKAVLTAPDSIQESNEVQKIVATNPDEKLTETEKDTSSTEKDSSSTEKDSSTVPTSTTTTKSQENETTKSGATSTTTKPSDNKSSNKAESKVFAGPPQSSGTMSASSTIDPPKSNVEKTESFLIGLIILPLIWMLCFAVMK